MWANYNVTKLFWWNCVHIWESGEMYKSTAIQSYPVLRTDHLTIYNGTQKKSRAIFSQWHTVQHYIENFSTQHSFKMSIKTLKVRYFLYSSHSREIQSMLQQHRGYMASKGVQKQNDVSKSVQDLQIPKHLQRLYKFLIYRQTCMYSDIVL